MPRVTLYIAQSLNGFVAERDGGVGWLPEPPEGEDFGYGAFWDTVDALAMGRTTYDQIRSWGAWPYEDRPALVFTSREPDADPPAGIRFVSGDPAVALAMFPDEAHVWLVGGGGLVRAFREAGVLDVVHLFLVPVLLGDGIPLWDGVQPRADLALEWSREHAGGLEVRYRVAR
ncbi:MAG: dihydrofolate reductase family protein [Bacteroidota bacterium]